MRKNIWAALLISACTQIGAYAQNFDDFFINLKSATPFPKCYLHKEKWTFDS